MSRHRDIRTRKYSEDYDSFDDVYGASVEEDKYCLSPGTMAQFTYDRSSSNFNISKYLEPPIVEDESEQSTNPESDNNSLTPTCHDSSHDNVLQFEFSEIENTKLHSCVEELQNLMGNDMPESVLVDAVLKHNCNLEASLNDILSNQIQNKAEGETASISRNTKNSVVPESISINIAKTKEPEVIQLSEVVDSDTTKLSDVAEIDTPKVQKPGKSAEAMLEEYKRERENMKPLLNLVVIGHVDAGKSTLLGHLLFKMGHVQKKTMHKYTQESKKMGKSSFAFAWILDETEEERSRGVTYDVAQAKLETKSRSINVLDAPGHKDFIPCMITGAAQADVAILVIDATKGEFETGFEMGGQTREHTLLIRSLGVSQLAIAINKMDNVDWRKERFDEIISNLTNFLKQVGFKPADVVYVPCSGLLGENLSEVSTNKQLREWYDGPCLVDIIDEFKPPERLVTKPFRFCIDNTFKGMVSGKIESGNVQVGEKVLLMPNAEEGVVKTILADESPMNRGFAGDHVTLVITGIDPANLNVGNVICDLRNPILASSKIEVRLVTFNTPLIQGLDLVVHYQNLSEQASILKIVSLLNKSTGEEIKKRPRLLSKNASGIIILEIARPICVELYKDIKDLGRIMMRSKGLTIGAGLITKIF